MLILNFVMNKLANCELYLTLLLFFYKKETVNSQA